MSESPHLPADTVSAYLDGALELAARDRVEEHLAGCPECRADLANVTDLLRRRRRRRRVLVAIPLATAATLLLVFRIDNPGSPLPDRFRADSVDAGVDIVSPPEGATVGTGSVSFRWRTPSGTPPLAPVLYRITVTDDRGGLIWKSESRDTGIVLPDTVILTRDRTFLWYVDALLPGARAASTGIHAFRVAP
jgi:hypothetical protein